MIGRGVRILEMSARCEFVAQLSLTELRIGMLYLEMCDEIFIFEIFIDFMKISSKFLRPFCQIFIEIFKTHYISLTVSLATFSSCHLSHGPFLLSYIGCCF